MDIDVRKEIGLLFLSNLHTHTVFCDGTDTAEAFVKKAIEKNFSSLGFSCHTYCEHEGQNGVGVGLDNLGNYHRHLAQLRQKYSDEIEIYTGRELDSASNPDDGYKYDYTIGAVHFVQKDGIYYCIDQGIEIFLQAVNAMGAENLVANYYRELTDLALGKKGAVVDIAAHFDIILLEGKKVFDSDSDWYKKAACEAADAIIGKKVIIEINTGGLYRKCHNDTYPGGKLLDYMIERGADFTLSSDAHNIGGLDYHFTQTLNLLKSKGVKSLKLLKSQKFYDYEI